MKNETGASVFRDLVAELVVGDGETVSRSLYQDGCVKIVLFGFASGQELSEHTATVPAVLQFLSGEARVTLGAETIEAGPATLVHMPAHLPHGILARTETRMLLFLLKSGGT